jgi:hypothetical protein
MLGPNTLVRFRQPKSLGWDLSVGRLVKRCRVEKVLVGAEAVVAGQVTLAHEALWRQVRLVGGRRDRKRTALFERLQMVFSCWALQSGRERHGTREEGCRSKGFQTTSGFRGALSGSGCGEVTGTKLVAKRYGGFSSTLDPP